jgi:hypothetical protein
MGCSMSGLNALYDAATGGGDVWINERRFRVLRQIGEGGFAFVYLVRELQPASDAALGKRASHVSGSPSRPLPGASSRILDFVPNGIKLEFVGCFSSANFPFLGLTMCYGILPTAFKRWCFYQSESSLF